jgi:hypothetical protein
MKPGGEGLEFPVPFVHGVIVQAGGAHQGNPSVFVHKGNPFSQRGVAQHTDNHLLLIAKMTDFRGKFLESFFQYFPYGVLGRLENFPNGRHGEANLSVHADGFQLPVIILHILPVICFTSARRPEQSYGIVIKEGASGKSKGLCQFSDGNE